MMEEQNESSTIILEIIHAAFLLTQKPRGKRTVPQGNCKGEDTTKTRAKPDFKTSKEQFAVANCIKGEDTTRTRAKPEVQGVD
ncbi:MAG: hypothetical protein V3R93_07360 [Candidatus Hydrothermarchaeaceae archaeon]